MKVYLTVDLEPDCPPYLKSWRGLETGVGDLLALLQAEDLPATFFTTGDVARRYPAVVARLVEAGHELGAHGDTHRDFTRLTPAAAAAEIAHASATLRNFAPVTAFRAPYLKFPDRYLPLLTAHGYAIDSSQAKYKVSYYCSTATTTLRRLPVSATSSVLRLPDLLRWPYLRRLTSPVVLFVHPWEFVDLRQERLRLDCRFKTGAIALACLQQVIHFFKAQQATFHKVQECTSE